MSGSFLERLPRFPAGPKVSLAGYLHTLADAAEAEDQRRAAAETTTTAAAAPAPVPEPAARREAEPASWDLASSEEEKAAGLGASDALWKELKDTIAAMNIAMTRIEREAEQRAAQMLGELAERLFPALARQFLAEEIVRHLPGLLPRAAPTIRVEASELVAMQLEAILEPAGLPEERFTVVGTEKAKGNRVTVSWGNGGVDFEFDALLADCLKRLQPEETRTGHPLKGESEHEHRRKA